MPFDAPSDVLTALAQAVTSPAAVLALLGAAAALLVGRFSPQHQAVPVRLRPRRRR